MTLSWDLYDFVREVSLLTIPCRIVAVFLTLSCMLGRPVCMLGWTYLYATWGPLWWVGPNIWTVPDVMYDRCYFDKLTKLCAYGFVV